MKDKLYFNQAFADILRKHRVRTKLTQTRLAFALDSNEKTIRRFEYGKQTPSSATLILMAETFGFEPSVFLKEITDQMTYLADRDSPDKTKLKDKE